jgi:hypothetical protein
MIRVDLKYSRLLHLFMSPFEAEMFEDFASQHNDWIKGRQGTGYFKADIKADVEDALIGGDEDMAWLPDVVVRAQDELRRYSNTPELGDRWDAYLLFYPSGTSIPAHKDPVLRGLPAHPPEHRRPSPQGRRGAGPQPAERLPGDPPEAPDGHRRRGRGVLPLGDRAQRRAHRRWADRPECGCVGPALKDPCQVPDTVLLLRGIITPEQTPWLTRSFTARTASRSSPMQPFRYCTKMCSRECSEQYETRAQERGGYHVMARDQALQAKGTELLFLKHAAGICSHPQP